MNLRLRERKEKYCIVEVRQGGTRALLLGVDDDKKLTPEKIVDAVQEKELKRLAGGRLSKRTVIVAVDPSLALTVTVPLKLERDHEIVKTPVSRIELENLLAQAMTKIFRQYREQASYYLHVDEIDAVLVGNRVHNFKIDGHRIVNPLGFRGRRIEAVLDLTLTTREIFDAWKDFFSTPDRFHFTEIAQAELSVLHRAHPLPIHLLSVESKSSSLFMLEKAAVGTMMYRTQIPWGTDDLLDSLDELWGLGRGAMEAIYRRYKEEGTSSAVARLFERQMKGSLALFTKELQKTRVRGKIYVESGLPLPFSLPHRLGRLTLQEAPAEELFKKFGFTVNEAEWPFPSPEVFGRVAPFLEFYYDKSESPVNQWLRRRLHWLAQ